MKYHKYSCHLRKKKKEGGVSRIGLCSNCLNSWKICKYQLMADWEGYPLHECVFHNDIRRLSQLLRVNDVSLKDMHGIIHFFSIHFCFVDSSIVFMHTGVKMSTSPICWLYTIQTIQNSIVAGLNSGHC